MKKAGSPIDENKIVHASGKVRIDVIDMEGILNEKGERTHKMHSMRRYIE